MAQSNTVTKSFLLFIIQPFIGFLASLRSLDSRVGKFIFVAFATLWGYAQSFTYTPTDGYRVAASFCQHPIKDFSEITYIFAEGNAVDAYLLITNYLVHMFSDNAKMYFALLGFVFGLFCCLTLSSLIEEKTGTGKYYFHILFLLFTINSFAWLTAPRFFTATWLGAYAFLKITRGEKKWVWATLFLPWIHFAFIPIAIAILLFTISNKIASRRIKILFWSVSLMFLLSFVLPKSVIANLMPQELMEENSKFASKASYVTDSNSIAIAKEVSAYREANGIVTRGFHLIMKISSFIILAFFYVKRQRIKNNKVLWITYISVLIAAFFSYFMSIIPNSGWRYINVLWLFLLIFLFRYYDVFHPMGFNKVILSLYAINIYTISFMFYVTYRTVDMLLFYAPLPFVIIHGIGFPPVYFV